MQDGGPSPAEHGRAEESAGMGAWFLYLSDVAASPGPPPASRCLGPRSARVAAWGEWDGVRPAARGGAAALMVEEGAGGGRPGPTAGTVGCSFRILGLDPLSRGLGLTRSG